MLDQDDVQRQGYGQHREKRAAEFGGFEHDVVEVFQLHLVVHKGLHQNRIHQGHGGGLSGGEETAVNASQQNNRHHHGPDAFAHRRDELCQAELLAWHVAVVPDGVNRKYNQDQNAGANTGQEQISDRGFRNQTVDDHRD